MIHVEQVETILRRLLSPRRQGARGTGCIADETLAEYLSGVGSEESQLAVEAHMGRCSACADDLVAAYQAAEIPGPETVPGNLVDRTMGLIRPGEGDENVLDLVVSLVVDSLRLVSTSGYIIQSPAPAWIRGRVKSSENPILQVDKELKDFHVSVDLERLEGDLCQVAVTVKPKDGSVTDAIRMSLVSGGREQASYLARQGTAIFERIEPGNYRLEVFESGHSAGSIRLTIKEGGHE